MITESNEQILEQILEVLKANQEVQEHHTDLIEHLNKRLEAVEGERDKLKESLKILEELKTTG